MEQPPLQQTQDTDIGSKQHKIQWREKNNLHMPDNPYIVLQTERFECHHGPDRNKAKKVKAQNAQQSDHSAYQKKRFHIQTTKKLNCPATIIAKEMICFTDFKDCISKYKKEQLSRVIRSSLTDTDIKLAMTRHIFISLPQGERNGHQNHLHREAGEVSIPVDKRIISKIEEYVGEGLVSSSCLRPLLEQFVRHEIFAGEKCANWTNRRFFPSQRDISNFVYAAKLKGLKAKYDQENLMAHVDEWQKDRPEDKFLFSGSDVNTEDTGDSTGFFFLYSLKDSNWLTDKVMDAYLTYIAQTEMDKGNIKVRHQLVSSTNNIINGKYVPGRHEKNKLIPYDFVIGAYHQRGGHWDLLIVEPSKGKVVFLNPLGASPNQKRTVLLNWRKYIGQMLLLHPENGYKNWTLEVPDHSKQLDGSSCGIFCLLFAEKYLAGQSLLGITQEEVNNKRVMIAHTLMMFEGHMVGCCPCCGFRTNADEEQLIQCKICKNLFHRKTHCVGEAFATGTSNEDFVCEIDRTVEKK